LEHGELVAQDQDLDLLGGVGSSAQHGPAQELREHLVDQPRRHQRIMPDCVSPGERAGQGLCAQFWALTGPGRNSALLALATRMPAATLSDTLGISITSAVQWTKRSKRDWHAYLRARSESAR
jgi:hypothetical protein